MLRNVVVIGFMGTGKTVIGKRLAAELGYEFVDTDSLIEEQERQSVSEIFRNLGEVHFRKVEKRVIHQISDREGIVVATGGGAVLDPVNVVALRKRGFLIGLA